jgi:hypothetical protein
VPRFDQPIELTTIGNMRELGAGGHRGKGEKPDDH